MRLAAFGWQGKLSAFEAATNRHTRGFKNPFYLRT
jgi:hypothetical protein